jgi:hypothetical protein
MQGGKAQEYVDISSFPDAAVGRFGQIPLGHQNDFHLEPIRPWKGNQPSLRTHWPDMFVILVPRWRGL